MNEPTHEQHQHPGHGPTNPESEQPPALRPRVWIGCLAAYNNGHLHGEWADAAVSPDELHDSIRRVLASSPETDAEEWAFLDQDDFAGYRIGEHDDVETVTAIARGIAEHGAAFAAWADLHDADPDMLPSFEDAYLGEYDSAEAWAETMLEDMGSRDELDRLLNEKIGDLARYVQIDVGAWAQDAWLGGDIAIVHRPGGGVWVFDARV